MNHRGKGFGLFIPTKKSLMELGTGAGAGLAAVVAFEGGVERLPIPYRARPWMPLAEIAAGAILGPVAAAYASDDIGMGVGIGLAVSGGKRLLQSFQMTSRLIPGEMQALPAPSSAGTAGFGATETTDSVLLGESSVDVEDVDPGFGDSPVEVEDVDGTFGSVYY